MDVFLSRHLRTGILAAGAVAGLLTLLFWPLVSVLEITNLNTMEVVLCTRMKQGEEFLLCFTHSVHKRPVCDTLRAEGGDLIIVKSRFDSLGAGMPDISSGEGTLRICTGGMFEWVVNRPVSDVTVRVGYTADHQLHLRDREIPFSNLAASGSPLNLRVRKVSLVGHAREGCIG